MPMVSADLADAIKHAITNFDPVDRNFENVWSAIADAIIVYIKANAVVSGAVTVTSVSGVTTGPGASGPGTGTMSAGTIA